MIADAPGLALFTISGAQLAEEAGLPAIIVIIMAGITGVAGGVMRHILTAEIPPILRRGHLYATAAIAGAAVYLVLHELAVPRSAAAAVGMAVVVALRFASIVWKLHLPVFALPEHGREIAYPSAPERGGTRRGPSRRARRRVRS